MIKRGEIKLRIKRRRIELIVMLCSCGMGVAWGQSAQRVSLFNGQDLQGWEVRGGLARYSVSEGMIVGTTVAGSPNTFLCTQKSYGDFVLEFEVKLDPGLNSGVQFRSHVSRGNTSALGSEEVAGYQVEITRDREGVSGGIWDEARRGIWLADVSKDASASQAFKPDEWNRYRVACSGDSLQTWVNDVPCADIRDGEDLSGFIGLQVHSFSGDKPAQVRWRNLFIQDLGQHEWKPLFDGSGLTGWHPLPGGQWEVSDGVLCGTTAASEPRHGLLVSDQVFVDFTARVVFKAIKGNSGFYFRCEEVNDPVGVYGFQAEIDEAKDVGGLYETGGRAWVVQPAPEDVKKWFAPQDWNTMTVSAHGKRIVVHVNGFQSAELKEDPGRTEGRLALQLHGGMDMDVRFKSVEVLVPVSKP